MILSSIHSIWKPAHLSRERETRFLSVSEQWGLSLSAQIQQLVEWVSTFLSPLFWNVRHKLLHLWANFSLFSVCLKWTDISVEWKLAFFLDQSKFQENITDSVIAVSLNLTLGMVLMPAFLQSAHMFMCSWPHQLENKGYWIRLVKNIIPGLQSDLTQGKENLKWNEKVSK